MEEQTKFIINILPKSFDVTPITNNWPSFWDSGHKVYWTKYGLLCYFYGTVEE